MTTTQAAYDAGVRTALALAEAVADRIAAQPSSDPRRLSAVEALRGLASDGLALLTAPNLDMPHGRDAVGAQATRPT